MDADFVDLSWVQATADAAAAAAASPVHPSPHPLPPASAAAAAAAAATASLAAALAPASLSDTSSVAAAAAMAAMAAGGAPAGTAPAASSPLALGAASQPTASSEGAWWDIPVTVAPGDEPLPSVKKKPRKRAAAAPGATGGKKKAAAAAAAATPTTPAAAAAAAPGPGKMTKKQRATQASAAAAAATAAVAAAMAADALSADMQFPAATAAAPAQSKPGKGRAGKAGPRAGGKRAAGKGKPDPAAAAAAAVVDMEEDGDDDEETAQHKHDVEEAQPAAEPEPEPEPQPANRRSFEQLPEAPVFRPSERDWADPIAYIQRIRPQAEPFGICKIIPPRSFKPHFQLSKHSLRFTPRVQVLGELGANARIKHNFMERLTKFWVLQGRPIRAMPVIDSVPVDLFRLHGAVQALGGYQAVCTNRLWRTVAEKMGHKNMEPSAFGRFSSQLRHRYFRFLVPYDVYVAEKDKIKASPAKSTASHDTPAAVSAAAAAAAAADPSSTPAPSATLPTPMDTAAPHTSSTSTDPASTNPNPNPNPNPSTSTHPPRLTMKRVAKGGGTHSSASKSSSSGAQATADSAAALHSDAAAACTADEAFGVETDAAPAAWPADVPAGIAMHEPVEAWKNFSQFQEEHQKRMLGLNGHIAPLPESAAAIAAAAAAASAATAQPSPTTSTPAPGSLHSDSPHAPPGSGASPTRPRRAVGASASNPVPATTPANPADPTTAGDGLAAPPELGELCEVCSRGDQAMEMLLCDVCDRGFHIFCLKPPLEKVPRGDWRCPGCLDAEVSKPIDYGFDQAQRSYTLQSFENMAKSFEETYWSSPRAGSLAGPTATLEEKEAEFWHLIDAGPPGPGEEDVEVEYGADLHSSEHGSGFAWKNRMRRDSAKHKEQDRAMLESPWNLNNLPTAPGSLLAHIAQDISGMTVPWVYVGMLFSSFCWHIEDHWTYSINYLHSGAAKTWYGIPGAAAEHFETAMQSAAPELFANQPDLLHHLTTLISPAWLSRQGVPVVRTDQHCGQFVVTFPRAYHAGFNNGLNVAEAVNFAPPDWLAKGRRCMQHYQDIKRHPVFSHDQLVCDIGARAATDPASCDVLSAAATFTDLVAMARRELRGRQALFRAGLRCARPVAAMAALADDARSCSACLTTCFLSVVTCACQMPAVEAARAAAESGRELEAGRLPRLACLDHVDSLCSCPMAQRTLRVGVGMATLYEYARALRRRAAAFDDWARRVRAALHPDAAAELEADPDRVYLALTGADDHDSLDVVAAAQQAPMQLDDGAMQVKAEPADAEQAASGAGGGGGGGAATSSRIWLPASSDREQVLFFGEPDLGEEDGEEVDMDQDGQDGETPGGEADAAETQAGEARDKAAAKSPGKKEAAAAAAVVAGDASTSVTVTAQSAQAAAAAAAAVEAAMAAPPPSALDRQTRAADLQRLVAEAEPAWRLDPVFRALQHALGVVKAVRGQAQALLQARPPSKRAFQGNMLDPRPHQVSLQELDTLIMRCRAQPCHVPELEGLQALREEARRLAVRVEEAIVGVCVPRETLPAAVKMEKETAEAADGKTDEAEEVEMAASEPAAKPAKGASKAGKGKGKGKGKSKSKGKTPAKGKGKSSESAADAEEDEGEQESEEQEEEEEAKKEARKAGQASKKGAASKRRQPRRGAKAAADPTAGAEDEAGEENENGAAAMQEDEEGNGNAGGGKGKNGASAMEEDEEDEEYEAANEDGQAEDDGDKVPELAEVVEQLHRHTVFQIGSLVRAKLELDRRAWLEEVRALKAGKPIPYATLQDLVLRTPRPGSLVIAGMEVEGSAAGAGAGAAAGGPQAAWWAEHAAVPTDIELPTPSAEWCATRREEDQEIAQQAERFDGLLTRSDKWRANARVILDGQPDDDALAALAEQSVEEVELPEDKEISKSVGRVRAWNRQADSLLNSKSKPKFAALVQLRDKGRECGLRLRRLPLVESKILLVQNWLGRVEHLFVRRKHPLPLAEVLAVRGSNADVERTRKQRKRNEAAEEDESADFCLCKTPASGFMICCELCHDWFHGRCVHFTQKMSREGRRFLCYNCCRGRRPALDALQRLLDAGEALDARVPETDQLRKLIAATEAWRDKATAKAAEVEARVAADPDFKPQGGLAKDLESLVIQGDMLETNNEAEIMRIDKLLKRGEEQEQEEGGGEGQAAGDGGVAVDSEDDGQLYCVCRQPAGESEFMVQCEECEEWFHCPCVGLTQAEAEKLDTFLCRLGSCPSAAGQAAGGVGGVPAGTGAGDGGAAAAAAAAAVALVGTAAAMMHGAGGSSGERKRDSDAGLGSDAPSSDAKRHRASLDGLAAISSAAMAVDNGSAAAMNVGSGRAGGVGGAGGAGAGGAQQQAAASASQEEAASALLSIFQAGWPQ